MKTFETLKQEILQKAKEIGACKEEYKRFLNAKNISEAQEVIINNLHFAISSDIINLENAKYFEKLKVKDNTIFFKTRKHIINKDNVIIENFYKNGQLMNRITYKNGKLNGLYEEWHYNGQIEEKINYKDGKKDGLYEEWYRNGQLYNRMNYKNGELRGLAQWWHYNGQLSDRVNYKNGELHGLWECWHYQNGQKANDRYYINNKEVTQTEWEEFLMSN